ncbi:hypothetical protein OG555_17835 [Kribbella sp. NBC_01484]|uniref:hypothetical protein n=1 Tax=Kribbella sp. NBC_01484 TaxID=2903579 RepID=UPI002E33EFDC|nr:hypothetical protein [Kribbella sp. NBC_01484]
MGWTADGKVRVSWQDSGTANFVRVEYPDLAQVLELTDANGPNEVLFPGLPERDRVRLRVTSRVDGVESTATPPSAWFDTWQPAAPKVEDANLPANLSTTVNWSQASSTSARSSKTLAKFDVAGFNLTSAQVGQMVKLTVGVRPAGTVKGALQRWDGKYWRSVLAVPVTKGKAVMYVRAAGRGTKTYYRVAVPKMSYYGLPIETTGSRSFTLAVR